MPSGPSEGNNAASDGVANGGQQAADTNLAAEASAADIAASQDASAVGGLLADVADGIF